MSSLDPQFFDDFYEGTDDPWGFETRWYELRKRAVTLAALPKQRYASVLELGCSSGVLTAALAERADAVLGVDVASSPLEQARRRLSTTPWVQFSQHRLPHEWPAGRFDLVVLSEVGYYFDEPDLSVVLDRIETSLTDDGTLVACHWRHPVHEYPLAGDVVVRAVRARSAWERTVEHVERDFVLDVFERPPVSSVAQRAGLA